MFSLAGVCAFFVLLMAVIFVCMAVFTAASMIGNAVGGFLENRVCLKGRV